MTGPALVLSSECAALRRRLGPLAWVALEDLALRSESDEAGWLAPAGVRDVAGGLGINKDTAARAVAALAAAGLVTRERLEASGPARRFGYRLRLPVGVQVRPGDRDTHELCPTNDVCPAETDNTLCPTDGDAPCPTEPDGDLRPTEPDPPRPSGRDGDDCPAKPDARRRRSLSDRGPASNDADRGGRASARDDDPARRVGGPAARQRHLGPDDDGAPSQHMRPAGEGRDGAVEAVDGRLSAGAPLAQREIPRRRAAAQNEAQGQLFDLTVTTQSQDLRP